MATATEASSVTVRVPTEDDFGEADYLPDAALDDLLTEIVGAYRALRHIEDHGINVSVLWKRKGGKKQGAPTFAKCQKPSGLLAHFCTADFVIWLGADNIAEQEWTTAQIRKLLYHECLPAGTQIASPEIKATSARWYSGQMVEISTASGHLLTGTPNHPVLTARGWVPFDLLKIGDDVLRCGDPERVAAAVDPHKYQAPTAIEEVVRSLNVPLRLVPPATHDLHADRMERQIDVVAANRRLLVEYAPLILKHGEHFNLSGRHRIDVSFASCGHLEDTFLGHRSSSVQLGNLTKLGRHAGVLLGTAESKSLAFAMRPNRNSSGFEPSLHEVDTYPQALRDRRHGLASSVWGGDLIGRDGRPICSRGGGSGLNATTDQELGDGLVAHAKSVRERLSRVPGDVSPDKVVRVSRHPFSGHVYNLQTSQEWYIANGIIVHNCRHVGWDDGDDEHDAKPVILGHDVELFVGEIADVGAWEHFRKALGGDFKQAGLL